jgi:hypothetical protein
MRGAYSTICGAIFCLASIYWQVGTADGRDCNPSQRFPYAPPHIASHWRQYVADLTPAQQQVIVAVLAGESKVHGWLGESINDKTLFFALPGDVLTLWFGEAASPTGEFPLSLDRCGPAATTVCRFSYPVLGSPNIRYFPSRDGGIPGTPPAGLRWVQTMDGGLSPAMDRVARDAYAKYRVPSPSYKGVDYFEPSC